MGSVFGGILETVGDLYPTLFPTGLGMVTAFALA
jgi:hypothetical protein